MEVILWCVVVLVTICLIKITVAGSSYNESTSLKGKVVIVTGANSGIGYEVALDTARRQATVILACRNETRGKKAESDIKTVTSNQNVRFRKLDLSSFESIRAFVKGIKEEECQVYALVNNAGLFWVPFRLTSDGFESNFGVNYLGHFLLTVLLLPLLRNSEESRVISVGSLMYIFGKIDLNDINFKCRKYNFVTAYSDSKLANLLFTIELPNRLKCDNIRTYCVDPGVVFTNIGSDSLLMGSFFYKYITAPIPWLFMKTAVQGAQSVIYCLCSDQVRNDTGNMYSDCERVKQVWPSAKDPKMCRELWNESVMLSHLKKEELDDILYGYN